MNNSERYWRGDDTVGRDDPDFRPLSAADIEEAMEVSEEYAKREIDERLTDADFSADDADWEGYSSQWRKRA